jgi:hypothetical protein
MLKTCWLITLIFQVLYVNAQSSSTLVGARACGMGYASSCLNDEWGTFNNIAGISGLQKPISAFTYDACAALPSFNRMAALVAVPLKYGVVGTGLYKFGDDLYNEQLIVGGFSNKFGIASLGIKINYIQYSAEGSGSKGVFTISFGGIAELTSRLSIGAHIVNINQPSIPTFTEQETVPAIFIAGLGYKVSDKIFIATDIEKDIQYKLLWKTGLEYNFNKKFSFRTGFNLNPTASFLGLAFNPKRLALHYAFKYDMIIGFSHQATVEYKFNTK